MTRCAGCGKPIVWGITEDGKRIPLDPRAPCYDQIGYRWAADGSYENPVVQRAKTVMVSHFATCPAANQFSASKKSPLVAGKGRT